MLVVSNEARPHARAGNRLAGDSSSRLSAPDLPDSDLLVLDPPPESTIDEAHRAAELLATRGAHSALLVDRCLSLTTR
jgi:hypothetical protein